MAYGKTAVLCGKVKVKSREPFFIILNHYASALVLFDVGRGVLAMNFRSVGAATACTLRET